MHSDDEKRCPEPTVNTHTEVVECLPADVAALLHTISDTAADFAEQLDTLRGRYPTLGLRGADPVAVVLDQAAAAAQDLHSSAASAANTIAQRRIRTTA
jgi:hypothetical protein